MSALERINATVPKPLSDYAQYQVNIGNFGNKSEYIRHLIRQDQENNRESQISFLNRKLQAGIESGVLEDTPDELRIAGRQVIKKIIDQSH